MHQPHAISIHLDANVLNGSIDVDHYDLKASLRNLASDTYTALRRAYPEALINVTSDARTGGNARRVVTDDEGNEADLATVDAVRELCGRVWESWTWVVTSKGSL